MKNKKGFTLIELLAVIVILAVIALIATPIIMNVINDAKKGAAKDSAYAIIGAAELEMSKAGFKTPVTYNEKSNLNYKGTKPSKMNLEINTKGKSKLNAFIDGYCVVKDYSEEEVTIDDSKKTADTCVSGSTQPPVEEPKSFAEDSWETIIEAVKSGNTSNYHVGDTKEVTLTGEVAGTHTVRIANMSNNDPVCSNSNYSQTACGFVLEFVDIITEYHMNPKTDETPFGTNKGGWPASEMRTYVNDTIYNALPEELRKGIINTRVVSGHGRDDSANFTSTDKLYLLSTKEVWGKDGTSNQVEYDTAEEGTRQLDYYNSLGVTTSNYAGAIKNYNGSTYTWWLRTAFSVPVNFYIVSINGTCSNTNASTSRGVAPAFRIG